MTLDLAGKRVTVVGMARSGVAAARLAVRRGAVVTCTDRRADAPLVEGTTCVYGQHRREDFTGADLVVVSPGVPAAQADVAAAVAAGITVLGELAFAAAQLDVPILAVTGTNGKSTTTHLLGQILQAAGKSVFVGGNLGVPLSEAVGSAIDVAVVEVSSYQMELPGAFRPHAAVVLNLTPDHLERHGDMETYAAHKCRVFARMLPDDIAAVPAGEPRILRLADGLPGTRFYLGSAPGVRIEGDELVLEGVGDTAIRLSVAPFPLPGQHNRENLAAAVLLAVTGAGIVPEQIVLGALTGLPHRMEPVALRAGVTWTNDSKATNVDSTLVALASTDLPRTHVLLGGHGKSGAPYTLLAEGLRRAASVTCFGTSGPDIARALAHEDVATTTVPSLEDAVTHAAALARPGEGVLLSPACASFDAFTDFEHRGRTFRQLAEALPT